MASREDAEGIWAMSLDVCGQVVAAKAMYCAVHSVDRGRGTGRGSPAPKTLTCG